MTGDDDGGLEEDEGYELERDDDQVSGEERFNAEWWSPASPFACSP